MLNGRKNEQRKSYLRMVKNHRALRQQRASVFIILNRNEKGERDSEGKGYARTTLSNKLKKNREKGTKKLRKRRNHRLRTQSKALENRLVWRSSGVKERSGKIESNSQWLSAFKKDPGSLNPKRGTSSQTINRDISNGIGGQTLKNSLFEGVLGGVGEITRFFDDNSPVDSFGSLIKSMKKGMVFFRVIGGGV